MKRIAALVLAASIAAPALADAPGAPIIEPVVVVEEASSSSSGAIVPILVGLVLLAVLAN